MHIKDMEILIECKKLVEKMLSEKQWILEYLEKDGRGDTAGARATRAQIIRMERALEGKSPLTHYDEFGREKSIYE